MRAHAETVRPRSAAQRFGNVERGTAMIAKIIDAGRTSSGKLVDYLLKLEDDSEIRMTSNEIKAKIQAGEMTVAGMQLDAAGRLVKAPQEKRSQEKSPAKPAKEPRPAQKKAVETEAVKEENADQDVSVPAEKEEPAEKATSAAEAAKSVAAKSKTQSRTSKKSQKAAPAKPVTHFEPLKDVEVKPVSEEEKKKAGTDGKPRAFVKRIV